LIVVAVLITKKINLNEIVSKTFYLDKSLLLRYLIQLHKIT